MIHLTTGKMLMTSKITGVVKMVGEVVEAAAKFGIILVVIAPKIIKIKTSTATKIMRVIVRSPMESVVEAIVETFEKVIKVETASAASLSEAAAVVVVEGRVAKTVVLSSFLLI